MAQTKQQIQAILSSLGAAPRHRFGQNFMIDQNLVRLVAAAGKISRDDVVIEVGPGTGTLTEELLATGAKIFVVEIDRDLASTLRDRFGGEEKFELIEGDALAGKHALNELLAARIKSARDENKIVKLVANLPYNIASPLVIDLLIEGVSLLAFTVQKEVADRLRAGKDDDAYGPLSVVVQMLAQVEILRTLPPQAFWPAPKIESALVRLTRDDRLKNRARGFSQFVHGLFTFRRKTLRKAMTQAGHDPELLIAQRIDPQFRPENLTPLEFLNLFDAVNTA